MPVRTSRKHPLNAVRAQGEGSVHFSEAKVNATTVDSLSSSGGSDKETTDSDVVLGEACS